MAEPDTQVQQLYEAPREQFTAVRDRLARALRDAGDREAAQAVKQLRKPSIAAWALNQLRHRDRKRLAALLAAGEQLEQAQRQLLAGGDRGRLRDAAADERRLASELAAVAERTLADAGHPVTATVQNRLRDTLHAAAGNQDVRELLGAGRLTRDYQISDLGLPLDAGAAWSRGAARRDRSSRAADASSEAARRHQAGVRRLQQARARSREAKGKADEAARAAAQSQRALAQAQAAMASAETRAERARQRAEQAAARVAELDAELKRRSTGS